MRLLSLVGVACLGACDVVWGLSGEPDACQLGSFDELEPVAMITQGEHFTVTGAGDRAVVDDAGALFERTLAGGDPTRLELGPYQPVAIAVAPEGTLLFHSSSMEPPLLEVAVRIDGVWVKADRVGPKGVIAGVPSAEAFGARRVIVRTREVGTEVQEYEDDGVAWQPVGERQQLPGMQVNLTENGLTMVFVDDDPVTGAKGVFAANRDSRSEWFGTPLQIRSSDIGTQTAQLLGKTTCDTLFVSEPGALVRFDR